MKRMALKEKKSAEKVSNETFKVRCDNCENMWELHQKDIKSKHLERGVEWRYFECAKCRARYTTYVGNKEVERLIRFRNECRQKIKRELNKGAAMNQSLYHSIRIEDEQAGTKIAGIMSRLKKELNIEQKEKEFIS